MYILDHYNYVSWLLVHLNEMANVQKSHSAVYEEFHKGKFTVQKKTTENFEKLHSTTTMTK